MNKLLLTTAALLFATGVSHAQQSTDVAVETKVRERNRPVPPPVHDAGLRALDEQRATLEKQRAEYAAQRDAFEQVPPPGGPEGWTFGPGFSRGPASRALLLNDQPATAETLASSQEDATVMLRLLEKATRDDRRDDPMRAMGIHIEALGGRQGPQAIYLGGFGALFLLNVDYPLVAPAAGDHDLKQAAEGESEWERTKRELYGRPGRPQPPRGAEAQPFDANRVERLKSALIDALANAANLRQLASGEAVLVSVTGPGSSASGGVRVFTNRGGSRGSSGGEGVKSETRVEVYDQEAGPGGPPGGGGGAGRHSTQLTLKALKSDIDAFAKKTITRETFAQRVQVTTY